MTACVNRKHTKKVAAVVTASLVGALSLGAAPVAAVADTGIGLQAADAVAVAKGTVTYRGGEDGQSFVNDGLAHGLIPTKIEYGAGLSDIVYPADGDSANREDGFYYYYVEIDASGTHAPADVKYTDSEGNEKAVKGNLKYGRPSDEGTYAVVVGYWNDADNTWDYVSKAASFTISGKGLTDSTIYQGDDVTDTTFDYSGVQNSLLYENFIDTVGVAIDGKPVDTDELYMSLYNTDGSKLTAGDQLVPGTTYILAYQSKSNAGDRAERKITIEKLNLSDASIAGRALDDTEWNTTSATPNVIDFNEAVAYINGIENDESGEAVFDWVLEHANGGQGGEVSLRIIEAPGDSLIINRDKKGAYTVEIKANANAKYVTGSKTFTVYYGDIVADVDFGNADLLDGDHYYVDLNEDQSFDATDIIATYGADGTRVKNSDLDIAYLNADGTEADADALKTPGTHYVRVSYNKDVEGDRVVASAMAKVVTSYTVDLDADVFMSYDGENVDGSDSDSYTGEDLFQKMAFKVTAGDKVLEEGDDYTVKVETVNEDGDLVEVDSIVDAGIYYITVEGKTFPGSAEFSFEVTPCTPFSAEPVWDLEAENEGYLMYTGEVLTPAFRFFDTDGDEIAVPEGSYVVDSYDYYETETGAVKEKDAELKEVGFYTANISTADGVKNYNFDRLTSDRFEVSDKGVFLDVPMAGEWYSQSVYDAVNLGYMNGYAGTKVFGAGRTITRGEVACVLFNMAGGNLFYGDEMFDYNELVGYETGFSDVDGKEFYAKPIAWAKAAGVVNGYGDGTFAPDAPITAEEFCAMLANYAEALGDDVDGVDQAVLDSVSDADQVSGWAKQSVAWAVENEVMGNGGFIAPQESIKRERVAAMAVNYQPEKLNDVIIPVTDNNQF